MPTTAAAAATALASALDPQREAHIDALLARMTLEEKAGQLTLEAPADNAALGNPPAQPSAERADVRAQLDHIRAGLVSGLFNGVGVAGKRRAQEAAMASRLQIPLLFAADVIHGFRTIFPVPLGEAASWDPLLAERTARAAAVEAAADGFHWTFAPMVDIARDARWGRGVEGAGEDVLLASRFAAARVRGFQGDGLGRDGNLLATPKHFAAYGAAEGGIDYNTVDLSERTLREVYLPPFKAAVDAGALSVMSAFNEIDGVPATANEALLSGVLRREWGFRGFVVADYTADAELVSHGVAADEREAVRLALQAGTDMALQSGLYRRHLPGLVASGEVSRAQLDEAVRRVLRVKHALGLFDQPFRGLAPVGGTASVPASTSTSTSTTATVSVSVSVSASAPAATVTATAPPGGAQPAAGGIDREAHRSLAREAARRSVVMLKNDGGLLPLDRAATRIALVGPFASGPYELNGPWSLFAQHGRAIPIDQGLREAMLDPSRLAVVPGCAIEAPLPGGLEAAVAAARQADVVVLAIGESEAMSGESRSRADITLPRAQMALAEAVADTGKPVVVLLRNGRPLALQGAVREARAILVTWFLGDQTGPAIADLLFGDHSPSGRLPVSFPQSPGQVPYVYAHKPTGRPAPAGYPAPDYTARYLDTAHAPLYAFGHGLGYAPVRYEALQLDAGAGSRGEGEARLRWDGTLQVRARVRNAGSRAVDETVQLYVRDRVASVTRPVRELKAFQRVRLAPGQAVDVAFTLQRGDLAFLGRDLKTTVEPGAFDLWVAPSAVAGLQGRFWLEGPGAEAGPGRQEARAP
jgi:beta-glucosidase